MADPPGYFCNAQLEMWEKGLTVVCEKRDVWHVDHTYTHTNDDGSRFIITWWAAPTPGQTKGFG